MSNEIVLHLMVGQWRTPNHSTKKEFDDTHEVKKEILKRIGKRKYSSQVGENPDLDIIKGGIIILKGTGKFKQRPYFITDIPADDYFVLRFITVEETNEIEIQVLTHNPNAENDSDIQHFVSSFNRVFILPNQDEMILLLVDTLTEEYLKNNSGRTENVVIFLSDKKQ